MTLSLLPSFSASTPAPVEDGFDSAMLRLATLLRAADYRFRTVTPATHQRILDRGQRFALDLGDAFGWNMPFQATLLAGEDCSQLAAAGVIVAHGNMWKAQWRAAALGDLIVFHSSYPTEQRDAVFFGPDTYRFISAIQRTLPSLAKRPSRVMEIGCGAGAAAIVLAAALPGAQVIAGDINSRALALTALNARVAQVSNLSAVTSNLLDGVDGNFDLIVANPPYMLDAEARTYRNGGGNYGEGLSVAMVRAGLDRLAPGGTLMLYTGTAVVRQCDQFWSALAPVLADIHCVWHYQEIDPDVFGEELEKPAYAKVERVAAVWLVVRMPD